MADLERYSDFVARLQADVARCPWCFNPLTAHTDAQSAACAGAYQTTARYAGATAAAPTQPYRVPDSRRTATIVWSEYAGGWLLDIPGGYALSYTDIDAAVRTAEGAGLIVRVPVPDKRSYRPWRVDA